MYLREEARMFKSALRRCGESVSVIAGNKRYTTRAVIETSGKNFMRKYDEPPTARDLGRKTARAKLAFMPFDKRFSDCTTEITIIWRGKRYVVISDSTMCVGDEPVFIWALLSPVNKRVGDYYGNLGQNG